jgi:hypothetical protein
MMAKIILLFLNEIKCMKQAQLEEERIKKVRKAMHVDRIDRKFGSAKLNLAIIERIRKIGVNTWGHVWEEGTGMCVFSELTDEFILNGISFLDEKYIKKIEYEFRNKEVYNAALNDKLPVALSRLRQKFSAKSKEQVFRIAKTSKTLVAIHPELIDKEVCYIGFVREVGRGHISIRAISSVGEWIETPDIFDLDDVTRIDIGSGYLRGLERFIKTIDRRHDPEL